MTHVLITGGLGFLGSNLADRLIGDGHSVVLLDDLSTGRMNNLIHLYRRHPKEASKGKILFVNVDITESKNKIFQEVDKVKKFGRIQEIYHLACPASPPKYYLNPLKTLDINYVGTQNILKLAKAYNIKVLFTSTSEIYGDPLVHPQPESYNGNVDPLSPRSVYDEGKRVAETLVSEYGRQGLRTRIVRISNTYGPRMDPYDGRVVTNFIKQCLAGRNITVYGDGSQTRSLCYVDDNIDGLIKVMGNNDFFNVAVNVGNSDEITMLDLAKKIKGLTGSWKSEIVFEPLPVSDPKQRQLDFAKLRTTGWSPEVSMDDGLKKTIDYMKSELELML